MISLFRGSGRELWDLKTNTISIKKVLSHSHRGVLRSKGSMRNAFIWKVNVESASIFVDWILIEQTEASERKARESRTAFNIVRGLTGISVGKLIRQFLKRELSFEFFEFRKSNLFDFWFNFEYLILRFFLNGRSHIIVK